METQFVNLPAGFPDFKVIFSEVVFEVIPYFVRRIGEFPRPDVVFEDSFLVEDNEGKVYCLSLGEFRLGHSCVFDQVFNGVEDEVDWLGRIVGHWFDNSCCVIKLLRGNAPVIILQKIEDGRDEWCDFSGDRITKSVKVFGVYSFDDFLDDGSFDQ